MIHLSLYRKLEKIVQLFCFQIPRISAPQIVQLISSNFIKCRHAVQHVAEIFQKCFQKHENLHRPNETLALDHTPNEIHRA